MSLLLIKKFIILRVLTYYYFFIDYLQIVVSLISLPKSSWTLIPSRIQEELMISAG